MCRHIVKRFKQIGKSDYLSIICNWYDAAFCDTKSTESSHVPTDFEFQWNVIGLKDKLLIHSILMSQMSFLSFLSKFCCDRALYQICFHFGGLTLFIFPRLSRYPRLNILQRTLVWVSSFSRFVWNNVPPTKRSPNNIILSLKV